MGSKGKMTQFTMLGAPSTFRAYSVLGNDKKLYVTLVNIDETSDIKLTLNPGNGTYDYAEGIRLLGSAMSSATNVTLGGSSLDANGMWSPRNVEIFPKTGNAFVVTIPKASAIVLTLSATPTWTVPGKAEAENYSDSSGIQSGPCEDVGGGKAVGHIAKGDWLEYPVNVTKKGDYFIDFRVASGATGTGSILIKQEGQTIGMVPISNTGGWGVYKTITIPLHLQMGKRTLRLEFDNAGGDLVNINWMEARIVPQVIPGIVQVEKYSDSTGISSGPCNDIDGTDAVGHISNGDWENLEVDVQKSMTYKLNVRVTSATSGGTLLIKSGTTLLSTVIIPGTGSWGTWQTFSSTIPLAKGAQTLRLEFSGGSGDFFNLNWLELMDPTVTDINPLSLSSGWSVFPNPSLQDFHIQTAGEFDYTLYDMAGHSLLQGRGSDTQTLGGNLGKGAYLLKIQRGTENHFVKLIKE
jgi:hypothetical protein